MSTLAIVIGVLVFLIYIYLVAVTFFPFAHRLKQIEWSLRPLKIKLVFK